MVKKSKIVDFYTCIGYTLVVIFASETSFFNELLLLW